MSTQVSMIRLITGLILLGTVVLGCAAPKTGKAQAATIRTSAVAPQSLPTPVLPVETHQPCDQLIPARIKLYGTLAQSGDSCLYIFQGASGDVITIHVTPLNQPAAPTVALLAPNGAEAVTSVVASGTVGSLIYGYRLQETGLHTLVVAAAQASAVGDFRLSLAGNTRCGGKISGAMVIAAQLSAAARYCVYNFTGQANTQWQLTARKLDGGADPEVDLFDGQGLRVAYTPTTSPERMQLYKLAADGVYTLLVNAAQMVDIGSFELALLPATEPAANPADDSLFAPGAQVRNGYLRKDNRVNLRRTPGYLNKPANDILLDMPRAAALVILGAAVTLDRLPWWPVRYTDATNAAYSGWVAQITEGGYTILVADE